MTSWSVRRPTWWPCWPRGPRSSTRSRHWDRESLSRSLFAATRESNPGCPASGCRRKCDGRSPSKKRKNLPWSVASIIALALLSVLALTVLPNLVSQAGDHARARMHPSVALGETVILPGNPLRPELQLSVDQLSPTRAVAPGRSVAPGHQLYAAKVRIHNVGEQSWAVGRSTTLHPGRRFRHRAIARDSAGDPGQGGVEVPGHRDRAARRDEARGRGVRRTTGPRSSRPSRSVSDRAWRRPSAGRWASPGGPRSPDCANNARTQSS